MTNLGVEKWPSRPLGEICKFQGGAQPPKSAFSAIMQEGYVRLLQIRDFKSDDKAVFVPDNGKLKKCLKTDIMIGRYGASVGQIHRGKTGAYNVALVKTIPNKSALDTDYFYHYLTSALFQKPLAAVSSRGAQDGFNQGDIAGFPVPLPPLEEQKRIVAVLDQAFAALDRARTNAEANLADAEELFDAVLEARFEGAVKAYGAKLVSWFCESIVDCVNRTAPKVESPTPYKMIRTTNIRNGKLDLQSVKFVSKETFDIWTRRQLPKRGDVLLTREAPLGETAIIESDDQVFLGQRIVSYRTDSNRALARFLYFAFRSKRLKKQFVDYGAGATVQHMRVPQSKELLIPAPPLEVQAEIVCVLDDLANRAQKLRCDYDTKLNDLEELRQSILQKAFTGELT